jgi:hypothetical protein
LQEDAAGNINDVLGNPTFNTNLAAGFPIQEAIINNTEQRRFSDYMVVRMLR